uniref:Peptidase M41 n=2 Tax=Neomoorella thermoacetica TaxID=1525 RepID=Q2RLN2_MOOTA
MITQLNFPNINHLFLVLITFLLFISIISFKYIISLPCNLTFFFLNLFLCSYLFNLTVLPLVPPYYNNITVLSIHEAGHAVVAETLVPGSVNSVRLFKPWQMRWLLLFGNETMGYTNIKSSIKTQGTLSAIKNDICVNLGGLAALEVLMPENKYIGAKNDLEQIEKWVESTVNSGLLDNEGITWNSLSDQERSQIAHNIIPPEYQRAKNIISQHKEEVLVIAEALRKNYYVTGDQVRSLLVKNH